MQTITLGRSELEVSRIAFGTWQLGGSGVPSTPTRPRRRSGTRSISGSASSTPPRRTDSEPPNGCSARPLRQELDTNRDSVIIATKGGINPGKDPARDSSREWLRDGVHSSLAALGVDYIDLYQVHWPDERTAFEDTAGYLQEMVAEGLIRHVGVSNFDAEQMEAFSTVRPVETTAAAVSLVSPRNRGRGVAVLRRAQRRRLGLQPARKWAADRSE